MDLEKNKQRIEILAAEVEELKNGGGGGTVDAYTKEEADNKFATNEELEGYVSKTDADNDYISKDFPIVGGTIGSDTIGSSDCITIGKHKGLTSGTIEASTVFGNYGFNRKSTINDSVLISSCGTSIGNYTTGTTESILIGIRNDFTSLNNSVVISTGAK